MALMRSSGSKILQKLPQVSSYVFGAKPYSTEVDDNKGKKKELEYSLDPKDYMELEDPVEKYAGKLRAQQLGRGTGSMLLEEKFYIRAEGTYDKPNLVPSHIYEKMVICYCDGVTDPEPRFMMLRDGMKRRCECGYWFEMIEAEPGQIDHF